MSSEDAVKYFDAAIELEGRLSGSIYTTMEKKGEGYLDKVNNEMSFEELAALSVKLPIAAIMRRSDINMMAYILLLLLIILKLLMRCTQMTIWIASRESCYSIIFQTMQNTSIKKLTIKQMS
ncbi:hypothetical protein QYZ88_000305 [Lachnospiraceae bacterium C1.1]|nr:hypothetical protein [Lachnospiraceae bacterium C1.1]